jgi:hypothetical protein
MPATPSMIVPIRMFWNATASPPATNVRKFLTISAIQENGFSKFLFFGAENLQLFGRKLLFTGVGISYIVN